MDFDAVKLDFIQIKHMIGFIRNSLEIYHFPNGFKFKI